MPGFADVVGVALATKPVYVNGQMASRKGEYFRRELSFNNMSAPVWEQVTVSATGETPVIGNVFVPRTPEAFTYDLDGNMTGDGRWNYTWDAENRLLRVETRSDTPQGSWRKVEWTYGRLGRRIRQTTSVWTNNAWAVIEDLKLISDPMLFGRHIVELNAMNNTLVRTYVWGLDLSGTMAGVGGVGGLLMICNFQSPIGHHFAAHDGSGNVVALVRATTGTETARYEYSPFAEPIRVTGSAASLNPFRFSTKRTCNTTDLMLYEYRASSHTLGLWLSRDPINEPGLNLLIRSQNPYNWHEERNLYGFVHNNPMDRHDALGLDCIWDPNIPTPQLPSVPDDVPDKAKECLSVPGLPSSSPECDKYGNRTYYGASLSCFCKCAGDSPWSKMVRGCLRCMDEKGIPVGDAHAYCYIAADAKHSRPWCTLAKCLCKCQ